MSDTVRRAFALAVTALVALGTVSFTALNAAAQPTRPEVAAGSQAGLGATIAPVFLATMFVGTIICVISAELRRKKI